MTSQLSSKHRRWILVTIGGALVSTLFTSPATSASAAAAKPTGNATFSLNLYRALGKSNPTPNLIESPYSVAEALSMLAAGTAGRSKEQLDSALAGSGKSIDPVRRAALRSALTSANAYGLGTEVLISNELWVATAYPINDPYRAELAQHYSAKGVSVPFAENTQAAIDAINTWASTSTKGLIPSVVSPDSIKSHTRAVLTNAIYFEGTWARQFAPQATANARFTLKGGRKLSVPTMRSTTGVGYGPNTKIVSLGFTAGYTMDILAPAKTTEKSLDNAMATLHSPESARKSVQCLDVAVSLPKWSATSTLDQLPDALKSLGVTDVFDGQRADLSPMSSAEQLYVSDVVQVATINVDEKGTKAAAVTAIVASPVSSPPPNDRRCPSSIAIDRPFAYVIRHHSGEIIFAGRVDDPSLT
jgi:serpin B